MLEDSRRTIRQVPDELTVRRTGKLTRRIATPLGILTAKLGILTTGLIF
jgi:hypothetical protein